MTEKAAELTDIDIAEPVIDTVSPGSLFDLKKRSKLMSYGNYNNYKLQKSLGLTFAKKYSTLLKQPAKEGYNFENWQELTTTQLYTSLFSREKADRVCARQDKGDHIKLSTIYAYTRNRFGRGEHFHVHLSMHMM